MKLTWSAELIEMPPILRDAKLYEKRALRVMTDSSCASLNVNEIKDMTK